MHVSEVEELERTWRTCRRTDFSAVQSDVAGALLEPAACLLNADTAVFRRFTLSPGVPRLTATIGVGIRDSVHDAYRSRYIDLDPARHLLRRRLTEPLFSAKELSIGSGSCPHHAGSPSAYPRQGPMPDRLRQAFVQYRREFLLPNDLYHHLGFCFQDAAARHTFFIDFHRRRASSPFGEREAVRAKIIAMVLHARSAGMNARHGSDAVAPSLPGECVDIGGRQAPEAVELPRQLSTRELEVAEAVAHGLSNKEVGAALDISVRTVENHLRSIFAKLEVSTRTRLAARMHELRGRHQGVAS